MPWTADDHDRLADDRSLLDRLLADPDGGEPGWEELTPDGGLPFVADDGGRAAAGFKGSAGDCVTRALAIATGLPYRLVYDQLAAGMAAQPPRKRGAHAPGQPRPRSARAGVLETVYRPWLAERGWLWTPTMGIGTGTTVHLRPGELPDGRLIVRCSRHLVAVIGGVVFDTADPCRGGTRAVYGYWTEPEVQL